MRKKQYTQEVDEEQHLEIHLAIVRGVDLPSSPRRVVGLLILDHPPEISLRQIVELREMFTLKSRKAWNAQPTSASCATVL